MKNVRMIIGVLALVFAFGAAVATKLDSPAIGWRVVTSGCEDIMECDTSGPQVCKDGAFDLYELETNNTCSTDVLRRQN